VLSAGALPTASGAAILIVDDRADQRVALRAMLDRLGHTIVEADSGRTALQAVQQRTFALILMDVRMPTLDGFETAKLCRTEPRAAFTPIIFVTAMGVEEAEAANAYDSGAVDFVFTPVRAGVLRAKVSAFVELYLQSQRLESSLASITSLNSALRESDILTQAVLDNVADGIFILDAQGLIESVNRSVNRLFGYEAEEPVGQPFASMVAVESHAELRDLEAAQADAAGRPIELLGERKDGSTFAMELERRDITYGERSFTLAAVRDISGRKAQTAALEHLALHDDLTGLANRTLFSDRLARSLAMARRKDEPRAVLVMDLDQFKQINDTLGHDRGDSLLKQVGERLVAALPEPDTVARLGGDEFGIVPAEATDLAAAASVAWTIQAACEPGFVLDGRTVHVSPSIGIALFPDHGITSAELLHRADLAMYAAKRSGRGHTVFNAVHETQTDEQLALLLDLRHCIAREELVLHYQPKIDLATRVVCGVEALVRWRHPTQGLLLPAAFMPEVERTHLIEPLTRWVLDEALRQQSVWREEGFDLTMAVNVSALSLSHGSSLPDTIAELTERWGTGRGRLTVELTEGALIEAAAPALLTRLHDMGQRLSIDDFGTGYSSLAYLQRLPVDELKIDRSFVKNLAAVGGDAIIVRSTIDLAHNLGLAVVAEGVEGEDVASTLIEYGCDSAQGYLFGRPLPAAELAELLPAPQPDPAQPPSLAGAERDATALASASRRAKQRAARRSHA
jgi:diguanylate cyclase (GGDEF)-like protein/PAS domain S-box-containing protein